MEIEVRKREAVDELLALHGQVAVRPHRKGDVLAVRAFELRRLEGLHISDGVRKPLAQFGETLFGVGRVRHLAVGEARAALGGEIGGELNLFAERQHVRIEPRSKQHFGLDFLCLAMGLGLAEQAGKAGEDLQVGGNGRVIKGHVMLLLS